MYNLIPELNNLAKEAGARIMEIYQRDFHIEQKADDSPVTEADLAAHHIIVPKLRALTPDITVISEESKEKASATNLERFWLVDPLDGTKSFIKKTGEFTVNIGLIKNNVPILGVVYIPATDTLFYTDTGGTYRQIGDAEPEKMSTRKAPKEGLTVVASASHRTAETDTYIENINVKEFISAGSSLKFCLIAEGKADIYPRFGPTMEWDTAAAHAVLTGAGGSVTTPENTPFLYGKETLLNGFFIAKA